MIVLFKQKTDNFRFFIIMLRNTVYILKIFVSLKIKVKPFQKNTMLYNMIGKKPSLAKVIFFLFTEGNTNMVHPKAHDKLIFFIVIKATLHEICLLTIF